MNHRIDGPVATQAVPSLGTGLSESLRSQAGRLQGESVTVLPPGNSVLGDAAEEVTMLFAEKAEKSRHEDRVVKAAGRPSLTTVEQISAYLDGAHKDASQGGNAEVLAQQAQRLLEAGGENLYALARSHPRFQQPTEQFLLFQYARQLAADQGLGTEVLARFDAAIADLDLLYGDQIQTHLLTIEPAAAYGQTAQEVGQFQGALRTVLGAPSMAQALQQVLQLAGQTGERLDSAMSNLMKALGACLGSGLSSQERLLETVVSDLFHLKSMNTVLAACRDLVGKLPRRGRSGGDAAEEEETTDDHTGRGAGGRRGGHGHER